MNRHALPQLNISQEIGTILIDNGYLWLTRIEDYKQTLENYSRMIADGDSGQKEINWDVDQWIAKNFENEKFCPTFDQTKKAIENYYSTLFFAYGICSSLFVMSPESLKKRIKEPDFIDMVDHIDKKTNGLHPYKIKESILGYIENAD